MERINYHHLLYFWMVAREGSVAAAAEKLNLSQPTVSGQIKTLEESIGEKLLQRVGRSLALTETGRVVFRYADEIFGLGQELVDTLRGRPTGQPLRVQIGVADVLPKLIVHRLLEPVGNLEEPVRLSCFEGKPNHLIGQLAAHALDVVLSDAPMGAESKVKAYNHLLGECGVTFFGVPALARKLRPAFPQSLHTAPVLCPTENTTLRRALDGWFERISVRPDVVGEFEDSALLKVFGQKGLGVFPAPSAIEAEVRTQYRVHVVGRTEEITERFYAISVERRMKHPAVVAIAEAARRRLFARGGGERSRAARAAAGRPVEGDRSSSR